MISADTFVNPAALILCFVSEFEVSFTLAEIRGLDVKHVI